MYGTRQTLGLIVATTLVCGFAFLLLQAGLPPAHASGEPATTLGWLGGCYPPALAVGRYFPGDAPCRPSQTIALGEIEFGLKLHGVMQPKERLEFAPQPRARMLSCWGLITSGGAQPSGWLCSDRAGVYRTTMDGRMSSARWQLTVADRWITVGDS